MPLWIVLALCIAVLVVGWAFWYAFIDKSDIDRWYRSIFKRK